MLADHPGTQLIVQIMCLCLKCEATVKVAAHWQMAYSWTVNPFSETLPSKHARSHLHLIWIVLAALDRGRPEDSCTPACFQTRSIWQKSDIQPESNRIQAGFAQYDLGCLSVCERMQLIWKWQTGSMLVAFHSAGTGPPMIFVHWLASIPDVLGQNLTRTSIIYISRSRPVLHNFINMIWAFFGRMEPNWMREFGIYDLAFSGCNGHNWLQPKCFWIESSMFNGLQVTTGWKYILRYFNINIIIRKPERLNWTIGIQLSRGVKNQGSIIRKAEIRKPKSLVLLQ